MLKTLFHLNRLRAQNFFRANFSCDRQPYFNGSTILIEESWSEKRVGLEIEPLGS
jgi:hypothetical protein